MTLPFVRTHPFASQRELPSVQAIHLGVREIGDGAVYLTNGQACAVLQTDSINLALAGDATIERLEVALGALLNGLTHPLQWILRILPLDDDRYVRRLEAQAARLPIDLARFALDQALLMQRQALNATMVQRRFYVVVPGHVPTARRLGWWPFNRGVHTLDRMAHRRELDLRCNWAIEQLSTCDVAARRLGDTELAALLQSCWCADTARNQRIAHELNEYASLIVRGRPLARSTASLAA